MEIDFPMYEWEEPMKMEELKNNPMPHTLSHCEVCGTELINLSFGNVCKNGECESHRQVGG